MTGNLLTDELTEKELHLLKLLAIGKTQQEMAWLDSIEVSTMYKKLQVIRAKLNANTDVQAVVIAVTAGLIE